MWSRESVQNQHVATGSRGYWKLQASDMDAGPALRWLDLCTVHANNFALGLWTRLPLRNRLLRPFSDLEPRLLSYCTHLEKQAAHSQK
jgi:hypothetical protein